MSRIAKEPRLPRCLSKFDLKSYFGCSYEYLWEHILTEKLLLSWGFRYELDVKPFKKFLPQLSRRIYVHFEITDLDANFAEEIQSIIDKKTVSKLSDQLEKPTKARVG